MFRFLNFIFFSLIVNIYVFSQNDDQKLLAPYAYYEHYSHQHSLHHEILHYLDYLDRHSDWIDSEVYGRTKQGRPLKLFYISHPENLKNIDNIRQTNMYNAGINQKIPTQYIEKAIVWCSFGVHGNEAGTTESTLNIVHTLISDNAFQDKYLSNTLVIIDPSLNPDGYDRYVHFIKNMSHKRLMPHPSHREHIEPWPTGRYNHYIFDLNRDWAWQTQSETKDRIKVYNKWLPHVHADFHEMGINSNYYFAPAAEPYHAYLSDFQREFQKSIGKNHAKYFDKNGWMYWTREVFDLFYPSYGDTYPTFSGAIGMTYEQAGNSSSGRAIRLANQDTLTISQKIEHNTVVALSTIETTSKDAEKVILAFKKYFEDSKKNPKGQFKTYVLKSKPSLQRLALLFDRSLIQYGFSTETKRVNGYNYQTNAQENYTVNIGDMIIHTDQPRSVLLQVLMEKEAFLGDSLTYDITAWSIPMAYGVETIGLTQKTPISTITHMPKKQISTEGFDNSIAICIPWNDLNSAKILAQLHNEGIITRMAIKKASYNGKEIDKGSLLIHKYDNKRNTRLFEKVMDILTQKNQSDFMVLDSGYSDNGGDLGGSYFNLLTRPRVLTFSGRGIQANSCGEIWYYFDEIMDFDVNIIDWDNWNRIDFDDFNTIVLPDGYYTVDQDKHKTLAKWVEKGGRLIIIENAIQNFNTESKPKFDVYATSDDEAKANEERLQKALLDRKNDYDGLERRMIGQGTAGAIIKNEVDDSHPLSFGIGSHYFSLKTNAQIYPLQKMMWNVYTIPQNIESSGFIGHAFKSKLPNTVTVASDNLGRGHIVYLVDNPLFRCFWDNGLLLFSNAVFLNTYQNSNY